MSPAHTILCKVQKYNMHMRNYIYLKNSEKKMCDIAKKNNIAEWIG